MASTDLPSASVTVNAQATSPGSGSELIAVFTAVKTLGDNTPRLYASGKAALTAHGYSPGISYAAMHAEKTKRPFVLVPLAIATNGAASAVSAVNAPTGTSVVTVAEGASGTLTDMNAILTVVTGGTIGSDNITLTLSLDGGATTKTVRLGTANSYVIPDVDLTINFAAGTLVATEYYTWTATGPMWDSSGLTAGRTALAASTYSVRSWLVDGELNATFAGYVVTQAEAYETSNKRFIMARASTTDLSEATWALEAAAQAASYVAVTSTYGRVSLGFGRRRKQCPLTGWSFRRSPAWAASLREYEQGYDVHNTTWWRRRGPMGDWSVISTDTEHDERVDGGALAGSFTCFTSLDNESGIYLAKDLTRASSDSVLFLPNNVLVTNVACTIVQTETQRMLGQDVVKQADNTIDPVQAAQLEEAVNGALTRALLTQKVAGRGPRASSVRWTMSRDDDLSGADATITGVVELNLRGVISKVSTTVRVS